jgi:hypothetical protein
VATALKTNANGALIVAARMTRRLIVPLTLAAMIMPAAQTFASDMSEVCAKEFQPLRDKAEERGNLLKVASASHVGADVACKLIGSFIESEIKMVRYVEANATRCKIPPDIADHLEAGYKTTEALQTKICNAAAQGQRTGPAGPTGDFDAPH